MDTQDNMQYNNYNQNGGQGSNTHHLNKPLHEFGDIEMGQSEHIHQMLRLGFIRKVYGILSFQLMITVAFVCLAFFDSVKIFMRENIVIFWCCLALSLVIVIPLICFKSIARKTPTNYILLILWTICESYMVATCASFYPIEIVLTAAGMTAAVTIALTIYAFYTKTDFTYCGGMLFVLSALMFTWGFFSLIFGIYLNTLYCLFGVFLYSIYLIFDTQLVLGKFGNEYSIDDYIIAALNIYIDIIQLFLYILSLLGKK